MHIDCGHPDDGKCRRISVSWMSTTVCEACFSHALAKTRIACRHVGNTDGITVRGTGLVARKPAMDNYDWAAAGVLSEVACSNVQEANDMVSRPTAIRPATAIPTSGVVGVGAAGRIAGLCQIGLPSCVDHSGEVENIRKDYWR